MKSLLSMDAFKLLNYGSYEGKEVIRKIQQYLNNKYRKNEYFATDIGLVPCDGIYGRSTNKALVYALQTWASLLVSTGDPLRKGKACDTLISYLDNYIEPYFKAIKATFKLVIEVNCKYLFSIELFI